MKRRFEIASPPPASQQHRIVEELSFSAALDRRQSCKKSRRSERKRRVPGWTAMIDMSSPTSGVALYTLLLLLIVSTIMKLFRLF